MVFVHHAGLAAYLSGEPQRSLLTVGRVGHVGVSFFFVLSGFVLLWSTPPSASAAAFWWRRVARVVPLHLVTAAAALLLGFTIAPSLGPRPATGGWPATIANAVLLSSWVPTWSQAGDPVSWSLVCEAFFYALFPALALLAGRLRARGAWALLVGAALGALAAALAIDTATLDLSRVPLMRLPEFVAGVACGRLVQVRAWPRMRSSVALLLLAVGWVIAGHASRPYAVALATLPGFVALIGALGEQQSYGGTGDAFARWLSRPTLVRLGEWSFAFYLVHILVMRTIEHTVISHPGWRVGPGLALLLGVLALALGISALLHHAIEVPANAAIRVRTQQRSPPLSP